MSDDVVEAMARAICERRYGPKLAPSYWSSPTHRERFMDEARAAIRAVGASGGMVVGEMPQEAASNHSMGSWGDGYNAALAEVRANAVKVEGV